MHRQGETDYFGSCPICKTSMELLEAQGKDAKKKRIDVREGVWFELCPACFDGIRTFMNHQQSRGTGRHPALGRGRADLRGKK